MAVSHDAKSIVVPCIADGVISPGHAVNLVSNSGGQKHVEQSHAANSAWGIYVGDEAAALNDHVEVCIFGPCKAWLDGAITLDPPLNLANDADGHIIADVTNAHRCIGFAMEANGATENYGEVFVLQHDISNA